MSHANNGTQSAQLEDQSRKSTSKLEQMMQRLVGPIHVDGVSAPGRLTFTYLDGWPTYHPLDGLAYRASDGSQTQLVVTTRPLLEAWLRLESEAQGRQGKPLHMRENTIEALSDEILYSGALNNDAAAEKFAELPVKSHMSNSIAKVILFEQGQDEVAPNPPDQLGAAVMQGGRVYILVQPVNVAAIPVCKTLYERKQASELIFERCYGRELPKQAGYARLIQQAQALVDRVHRE
ncbi:hypothetical protein ACFQ3P_04455 [Paraburkholderia sabiae]|uniref:Uncharacterized protein n=1 Tax=Paraburkholderia sabiae TaxID=273251 RepID=A0ABU9QN03_9BURK|nr:hypothetical protein [Paraburkholderia sabiae]WJZ79117.1 hypothetical protein QEN71_34665 [Paraburkholderia sabiae]CAD6514334.1 hypothetical protein LMG24235_00893 [Paraburkholderia sabiae]